MGTALIIRRAVATPSKRSWVDNRKPMRHLPTTGPKAVGPASPRLLWTRVHHGPGGYCRSSRYQGTTGRLPWPTRAQVQNPMTGRSQEGPPLVCYILASRDHWREANLSRGIRASLRPWRGALHRALHFSPEVTPSQEGTYHVLMTRAVLCALTKTEPCRRAPLAKLCHSHV